MSPEVTPQSTKRTRGSADTWHRHAAQTRQHNRGSANADLYCRPVVLGPQSPMELLSRLQNSTPPAIYFRFTWPFRPLSSKKLGNHDPDVRGLPRHRAPKFFIATFFGRGDPTPADPSIAFLLPCFLWSASWLRYDQVFIDKGPYAGEKLQNDIR